MDERHAAEIRRLHVELSSVKAELARYQQGARLMNRLAGYITYGPDIHSALTSWEAAYSSSRSRFFWRKIPLEESIALAAAYLRRRALSGMLIAVFAALPAVVTAVLLWQQNRKIDLQIQLTGLSQAGQLHAPLALIIAELHAAGQTICLPPTDPEVTKIIDALAAESSIAAKELQCYRPDLFGKDRQSRVRTSSWVLLQSRTLLRYELHSGYSDEFLARHRISLANSAASLTSDHLKPEPPQTLLTQAKHFSNTLRPYRTLILPDEPTATPTLSREPVSPERGILLQAFATSKLSPEGVTFERAWAPGAYLPDVQWFNLDLRKAVIECSEVSGGDLTKAKLSGVRAAGVNFFESNLSALSNAQGADFRYASFALARLPPVAVFKHAKVDSADFNGAIAPTDKWLSSLTGQLVDEYEYQQISAGGVTYYRMMRKANKQNDSGQPRASFCERREAEGYAL